MFKPLFDRVVVREDAVEVITRGGVMIPEIAKEKSVTGEVLSVGCGVVVDGVVRPLTLKEGDKVMFRRPCGTRVLVDNEPVLVMRELDVMVVID